MPFVKNIEVKNGIIGIWELTESAESLISTFQFTENETAEFKRFKGEKRQKEYLSTRLLLQHLFNEKTEIAYYKSGRPQFKSSFLNISISHSAEFVVVFISKELVGIDVESTYRKIDRVTKRFLNAKEREWIEKSENRQILKTIFWCAKEAIFKCSFQKGVQFDTQIFIPPFKVEETEHFQGNLTSEKGVEKYNLWYFHFQNNIVVYCVEVKN
jgi:4'-phosphopantetheinyl transferase